MSKKSAAAHNAAVLSLGDVPDLDEAKRIGVFAKQVIKKGDVAIYGVTSSYHPTRTDRTIQVALNLHACFVSPADVVNHSCNPNTGFRDNRWRGYDFVAFAISPKASR